MADIIETVPFNFDELYNGLEAKFAEEGYDTEPGSNTSQLVTAMAYLTSMLNVNTAVNINETILPLATQRNNVLQDARALGYEIQHKQSYTYLLTLTLDAGNHTIPTYARFVEDEKNYYYLGKQLDFTGVTQGDTIQILVVEGLLHKYTDYPDSLSVTTSTFIDDTDAEVPQYFIDIPFVDVEENGIEVFLTYYDDFGNLITREEWTRSETFIIDAESELDKEWVRLDNIEFNTPRIYFELAGVGHAPRVGSIVEMNVLTSNGVNGAMTAPDTPAGITHDLIGITVTEVDLVTQGTNEEAIKNIQDNAPKFYNTANRAVTKLDYEAICDRQTTVKKSMVWGGDDEMPKSPGHIWFSFLPSNYVRNFTATDFNFSYTLDNDFFDGWDYGITDTESQPYLDQVDAANDHYDRIYIQDGEIRAFEFNDDGQLIQPGVWDILDNYKIPTLEFHNRHPIYLDFEYDISVLRYTITDSNASLHESVFDTVDDFFTGTDEVIEMEKFESEYFQSSLDKRIDAVLTDQSGHTNALTTRLHLTKKNISKENFNVAYRDLYIPLAIPFEDYFDNSGYLLYNVLPSIDTLNFIEYQGETGNDLYTDWSQVQTDIGNTITQVNDTVISAPIRVKQSETVTLTASQSVVTLADIEVIPDDPTELGEATPVYTFNNTTVTLNGTPLTYSTEWTWADTNLQEITLVGQTVNLNDTLVVSTDVLSGYYHLFNSFRKYIIIQLYVDAAGFSDSGLAQYEFDTPKSYLTTTDGFYDYTIDDYYLTTEGYSIIDEDLVDATTGNIVKQVNPFSYSSSPIKMDLFRNDRYLNLNYNSANFAVHKNVIPRLKRVTFEQGV